MLKIIPTLVGSCRFYCENIDLRSETWYPVYSLVVAAQRYREGPLLISEFYFSDGWIIARNYKYNKWEQFLLTAYLWTCIKSLNVCIIDKHLQNSMENIKV